MVPPTLFHVFPQVKGSFFFSIDKEGICSSALLYILWNILRNTIHCRKQSIQYLSKPKCSEEISQGYLGLSFLNWVWLTGLDLYFPSWPSQTICRTRHRISKIFISSHFLPHEENLLVFSSLKWSNSSPSTHGRWACTFYFLGLHFQFDDAFFGVGFGLSKPCSSLSCLFLWLFRTKSEPISTELASTSSLKKIAQSGYCWLTSSSKSLGSHLKGFWWVWYCCQ